MSGSGLENATFRRATRAAIVLDFLRRVPALVGFVVLAGCATTPTPPGTADHAGPPAWLRSLPRESNAIFAVGIAGPTYFPEDSLRYAQEDARVQLSHALASKITAITVTVTNEGNSGWTDSAGVVESVTGDYTDAVVELSEIVGTWVDRSGSYSGKAGTSYALARLDLSRAPSLPARAATGSDE